jgi:hypothetical protein
MIALLQPMKDECPNCKYQGMQEIERVATLAQHFENGVQ